MIAITGARGFVGRATGAVLRSAGRTVVTIGRGEGADVRWPLAGELGAAAIARISGVRAVVHLAGETIGVRWTPARKREIMDSRAAGTARLARALAALDPRPEAFICASAVGYYGSRGDEWLDEASRPGDDFLARVARGWEDATTPAADAGIRVVRMRLGLVFGPGGGMLAQVRLPFRLGLGGTLGSGRQWMSWIALDDLTRFIAAAIDDRQASGPFNLVSPTPVRNAEFTAALGRALRRPAVLPVPAFALRALFGDMADGALLASQRVRPARLLASGFVFSHPTIETALDAAFRSPSPVTA